MSYCFDVMMRVFNTHIDPVIDPRLAIEFSQLISEMHSANHKLNDKINQDGAVSQAAKNLDVYAKELEARTDSER